MPSSSSVWLFEVAWEVANRVGGIYTVIKTKAPVTAAEFKSTYVLIGPWNRHSACLEVEECTPPDESMAKALDCMRSRNIECLFGRWLIESAPFVLLFDVYSALDVYSNWLAEFSSDHSIPCPRSDFEANHSISFGYLVSWFLGDFSHRNPNAKIIAHFHEWQAGVALPLIKSRDLPVSTVFTTHATLLGRYLCAASADFYNHLSFFDIDKEAGNRGIYHRYCIERAAAHSADVFTTVSHITAFEAEILLSRRPDGVLPNGLSLVRFAAVHEFQNLHAVAKEKIHDFVRGHFYGHYDFDLENTLYFFTAGRYEFRNKGVDLFLESLSRLNARLKAEKSTVTVVVFIIMPAGTRSFNVEAMRGHAAIKQLKDTVNDIQNQIGHRVFESAARGSLPDSKSLLLPSDIVALKRRMYALRRDSLPPIVTHNLINDGDDLVLSALRRLNLLNFPEDRVKLIFHPEFLSSSSPLFGVEYDEFVRGCHLGVFPSYYEPWGYTPAECTVMGVPSVTTNLSGFGCYMEGLLENPDDYGIYIIDRRFKSVDESVEMLAEKMHLFCLKSRRQRINLRNRTERLSEILDWRRLGLEYVKARHLALKRKFPDFFEKSFASELKIKTDADGYLDSADKLRIFSQPSSPKFKNVHLLGDEEIGEKILNQLESLGLSNDLDE